MPNQIIASDSLLQRQCTTLGGILTQTGQLGLFVNDPPLTNSTLATAFQTPSYTGYGALFMAGKGKGVKQIAVGVWQVDIGPFTFTSSAGTNVINGWFVVRPVLSQLLCQRFLVPFTLSPGTPLTFTVSVQVRGLNVVCF